MIGNFKKRNKHSFVLLLYSYTAKCYLLHTCTSSVCESFKTLYAFSNRNYIIITDSKHLSHGLYRFIECHHSNEER